MIRHFIAFWNLENLFAPANYAHREPWIARVMKKDLKGWTQALFNKKLAQLSSVITRMNGAGGPDILGVCEVENRYVLDQLMNLLNADLPHRDYDAVHFDSTRDQRGIDTAFIYDKNKYTVNPATVFSHFVLRRTGTRDITQATFKTSKGNDLVALCNHWPARSAGTHESRPFRICAGETLSYWHKRIREELGVAVPIIAMGDFNDDPFDEAMIVNARATRERGDVVRARSAQFYNLAWNCLKQQVVDKKGRTRTLHGTLYHDGDGHTFDQLMVSRGLLLKDSPIKVDESSAEIVAFPDMVDSKVTKGPIRFGLPKGNAQKNVDKAGFSDHFPVSVVLHEK